MQEVCKYSTIKLLKCNYYSFELQSRRCTIGRSTEETGRNVRKFKKKLKINIKFSAEEECKKIEKQVNDLLEDSIFSYEKGDFRQALEKAKEAGRMERKA